MKNLIYPLALMVLFMACTPKAKQAMQNVTEPAPLGFTSFKDSVSYVLGSSNARRLMEILPDSGDVFDQKMYMMGLQDGFKNMPKITEEQEGALITAFQNRLQEIQKEKDERIAAENKQLTETFLLENAKKEGVVTTASGLQYKILREGTGERPSAKDKVEVHYEGRLIDGTVFDSSYKRGSTTTFGVTQVIKGWTEALQLMKEGAKYQLYIPSDLAYGNRSVGAKIKPGDTLIFDVELVKIVK